MIAGSTQRQVIYEDMVTLCNMFFPEDLKEKLQALSGLSKIADSCDEEEEQATAGAQAEEEEEEEEEDMDWK